MNKYKFQRQNFKSVFQREKIQKNKGLVFKKSNKKKKRLQIKNLKFYKTN